jgi:hypothetical protein
LRNEIGEIGYRLNEAFIGSAGQLIEQEGQDNRRRKPKNNIVKIYQQGIPQKTNQIKTGKKLLEIPESDPFAFPYTYNGLVIFESHQNTPHWGVTEDSIPGKAESGDDINRPVYFQIPPESGEIGLPFSFEG